MIERIRKRFIHVTIASVLVALVLIMGTFNVLAFRSVRVNADLLLDLMAKNGGDFPDRIPDEYKGIIEDFNAAAINGDGEFDADDVFDEEDFRLATNGAIRGRAADRQGNRYRTFSAVTDETPYEARYFSVVLNTDGSTRSVNTGRIASVSTEDAVRYGRSLQTVGATGSGFLGVYRYRVQTVSEGEMYLFLDCTSDLYNAVYLLILSFIIALAALLLISLLVILLSKRAIRPIEESYDKQRKFITNAGHELKTPLAIIDSCTEVLEMTEGENKWTEGIHEQVGRLTSMTAELISMAKMAESDLELNKRDLNLSELCRETLEPFGLMAEEHGLGYRLDIAPDISFFGNEQTLKQLCSILADNAVKYAVPGSTIVMSLRKKGRRVLLSSENEADNIKKGNRGELFERFYRGDTSHSQEKKGYGIGLSMAQTITELHNGRISAASEDGKVLTITASFPERGGSMRNIRKVTKQQEKYMKKNAKDQEKQLAKA
ncbi:MAG: HAMP domain-containing histidine kinase [Clostridia bacterium]|nr:HAMP domain-containing histidine kinase [Clostridia bacterium]